MHDNTAEKGIQLLVSGKSALIMLMVCSYCRSKDIILVQGQNYCLNCGHLVSSDAKKTSAKVVKSAAEPIKTKIIKHQASLKQEATSAISHEKIVPVVTAPAKRYVSDILAPLEVPEIEAPEKIEALPSPKPQQKRAATRKQSQRVKSNQSLFSRYAVFAFMPALLTMWSVFILIYFGRYFTDLTELMGGVGWRLSLAATISLLCYLIIWLFIKNWATVAVVTGSQSTQNEHEDYRSWSQTGWTRAPKLVGQELAYALVIGGMGLAAWWFVSVWSPQAALDEGLRRIIISLAIMLIVWVAVLLGVTRLLARYISIFGSKKLSTTFFESWHLLRRHSSYLVLHFITWLLLGAISYGTLGMGLMLASSVRSDWVVYAVAALLASGVLMAAGFGVFSDLYWLKHFQAIASIQTSKHSESKDKKFSMGGMVMTACIAILAGVNYWLVWRDELGADISSLWPF